jgi:MHS family proline/betaine transporter-like MFS transporter
MFEVADVSTKTELPERKAIERKIEVTSTGDTVRTAKVSSVFEDGTSLVKTTKDVRPASGEVIEPTTKSEITLNDKGFWMMVAYVLIQVVLVTMVYGPIAAFLVELFPTKIRYTSMSLPYHIGNGVFGGLTPFIALYLTTRSNGDPFAGLWYPIGIAAISFIVGMIFLSNKKKGEVME